MAVLDMTGNMLETKVMFLDTSRTKILEEELQHSRQELETAYEELQSTNEELETANEELQSTNEELETVNTELSGRGDEISQANAFLESIMRSFDAGVVVVDPNLTVLSWNRKSEELWGLRGDEVNGKHFLNLDIGLPVDQLRQQIKDCLGGKSDNHVVTLEAVNRRGKAIKCRVTCTLLAGRDSVTRGVIFSMEETRRRDNAEDEITPVRRQTDGAEADDRD